jgi:hypothetical protein
MRKLSHRHFEKISWRARFGVVVLLVAGATPAGAEMLYKCVDANGLTTIQQDKCAKGTRQVWARESVPEPPPTPEQLAEAQARAEALAREQEAQAQRDAEAQLEAQLAEDAAKREEAAAAAKPADGAVEPPPPPPDPCEEAKAFAAKVRSLPWLQLDPGQTQRLWGWVVQECAPDR